MPRNSRLGIAWTWSKTKYRQRAAQRPSISRSSCRTPKRRRKLRTVGDRSAGICLIRWAITTLRLWGRRRTRGMDTTCTRRRVSFDKVVPLEAHNQEEVKKWLNWMIGPRIGPMPAASASIAKGRLAGLSGMSERPMREAKARTGQRTGTGRERFWGT